MVHISQLLNNYSGSYPSAHHGSESYADYRSRVNSKFVSEGFDVGDLTPKDYFHYCAGSGAYEGIDPSTMIS